MPPPLTLRPMEQKYLPPWSALFWTFSLHPRPMPLESPLFKQDPPHTHACAQGSLERTSKSFEVAPEQVRERQQELLWAPRDGHMPPDSVRAPAPVMNVLNSDIGFKASATGRSKPGLGGYWVSQPSCSRG